MIIVMWGLVFVVWGLYFIIVRGKILVCFVVVVFGLIVFVFLFIGLFRFFEESLLEFGKEL